MSILGVESVVFGVGDLAEHTRFWTDFGLPVESVGARTRRCSGSLRAAAWCCCTHGDARLPSPDPFAGDGLKETVWGVDTAASLEAIAASLASEVAVTRDADGTVRASAPMASRSPCASGTSARSSARPARSTPRPAIRASTSTASGAHARSPRRSTTWCSFQPDYVGSFEFYERHLGFRYTDHSKGTGIFARADGTNEHHSIFWVNCDLPIAPDHFKFMHIAFGMDDIDEVMLGANIMEAQGLEEREHEQLGRDHPPPHFQRDLLLLRHSRQGRRGRVSRRYRLPRRQLGPARLGLPLRLAAVGNNAPPIFRGDDIPWDMTFDADRKSFEPFRKSGRASAPVSGKLAEITEADEHAI